MRIPIRYFAARGIQEENADYFKDSFFSDVYRQAFDAIASVITKGQSKKKVMDVTNRMQNNQMYYEKSETRITSIKCYAPIMGG